MDNQAIKGKRRARKLALQALYQWLMTNDESYEIEAQFHAVNDMTKVDQDYFHRLLQGVITHRHELENAFIPFLDRPIQSLNPIELTVLRLSGFELLHCPEIPYRVVLDEAVSLTKAFGSQDGYRYVNGVLNNLARQVRAVEIHNANE
ncbi:transcription antitermination factor NusB [Legionella oakridgensis]|uniref:transcription antitermination factor NusB n=1 Tax=Legionella oakridgensis TaxID=29423 RepID=UPI00046D406F|nr:transcription antitermination factor NusB [Legionella oakridgensis]